MKGAMQNCTKNEKPTKSMNLKKTHRPWQLRDLGQRSTGPETGKIPKKPQISSFQASASGPGIEEWPFKMTISLLNSFFFFHFV